MSEQPGQKYAFFNLLQSLETGQASKAHQWREVLAAMQAGDLTVGRRQAVAGMPVWATPEIIRGGFSTTAYLAGGDLLPHEIALAEHLSLPYVGISDLRQVLNAWHLSDDGIAHLRNLAESGKFIAATPEEHALLTVALLMETAPDAANTILNDITPFFDRLRFYPKASDHNCPDGVFTRNVGQLRRSLRQKEPSEQVRQQHNSLTIWIPLYDDLADLLEERDTPHWQVNALRWNARYEKAAGKAAARRWTRRNSPFQRCRAALTLLLADGLLPAHIEKDVQIILARRNAKYGPQKLRKIWREKQIKQDVELRFDVTAKILINRLAELPADRGIADVVAVSRAISITEARNGAIEGSPLPASFTRKLQKARMAPVNELLEDGAISSPEELARVLPQMTAGFHASGFDSQAMRHVFTSLYKAFNKRRSLLLLNLEGQVKLREVPWGQALMDQQAHDADSREIARLALSELVRLTLTHFPHVIFPNALITEMSGLAELAGINIPFTREIAADIFMGRFSDNYSKAALISRTYYSGKLYDCYYRLNTPGMPGSFTDRCFQRANVRDRFNWSVASNGLLIEQQQILTSHNLAQIFTVLNLHDLDFAQMAQDCFNWICHAHQTPKSNWRAALQTTKNCAFAWRQMIAFLSELSPAQQRDVFSGISETLNRQKPEYQNLMQPALNTLGRALEGTAPTDVDAVFLGWSRGTHPFMPPYKT
ncbi:hypothetical protein [Halocynthiibacter sp.]|uniref:hypothetical protein n=1 Tax=Halocynthiibacter sp. TaxID=1979210 RepID=UPI003C40A6DB